MTAVAVAAALLYAAASGFRTLSDPDLPWQLRDARYLVETGSIARQELFSYTATGRPWMYPQGAGLIFYGVFRLGGFAALSWLGALACTATTAVLLAIRPGVLSAAVAALAVPLVASRTIVRADLFTTFLFALFLVLLIRGVAEKRVWLLPLLMAAWVNLHPGFPLGLGLIALFLLGAWVARAPVRPLALVAGLSLLATLLNPFGPAVWRIPWQQAQATALHRSLITEWWPMPWNWWRLRELLQWRDPDGAYWVLLPIGFVAAAVALWRRRWVPAALIAVFAAASLSALRFQALLAMSVGAAVAELGAGVEVRRSVRLAAAGALLALVALRVSDLATNRYYFSHPQEATFGAGLWYAFPERAAEFVLRQRLPGRILHDYSLGGYLSWKLGRAYLVFMDGRAIPFGEELLLEHRRWMRTPPDSPEWRALADCWGIQTVIVGLQRHRGYSLPLRELCESLNVRLLYLDEVSAVFLRRLPANQPWIERLAKNCEVATLPPRPPGEPPYIFHAHAARLYYELGRLPEALAAVEEARRYFRSDPELHIQAGRILLASGRPEEAQREFLAATALVESSRAWFSLGILEGQAGRHSEAIRCFTRALRSSSLPYEIYRAMAESYLALGQPQQARKWFQRALEARDSLAARELLGPGFLAAAHAGEARAQFLMGDMAGAEASLQSAVEATPNDPTLHLMRAEFYLGQGRTAQARVSLARAESLGAAGPALARLQERLRE